MPFSRRIALSGLLVALCGLTWACQTIPKSQFTKAQTQTSNPPSIDPTTLEASPSQSINSAPSANQNDPTPHLHATTSQELAKKATIHHARQRLKKEAFNSLTDNIPESAQPHVNEWIDYFQKYSKTIASHLQRGAQYKPMIESILEEQGVPTDVYYLAMIESGFQVDARSPANAVGIWQFIPGTARRYGLRVDKKVDERMHLQRSTEAACRYLKDLYNVFQSWELAMAAYNAGEVRILTAIMRGSSRDYWDLSARRLIPKETGKYIPKFLAAALIGKNPEKFGIEFNDLQTEALSSVDAPKDDQAQNLTKNTKGANISSSKNLFTKLAYQPNDL